jgi:succinate dehydrogenase/fumarate reductase cytochrome b subunit
VSHLSDDELVLHYYGEDGPHIVVVERHLHSCEQCARAYQALTRTLSAVVAPELVEPPDDTAAIRQLLHERVRGDALSAGARFLVVRGEAGAIALAWLVPVLYPFSFQALFSSAQWAQAHVAGGALVVLTLMWACAGPFVAMLALQRMPDRFDSVFARLRAVGALLAAIGPALFLLLARAGLGLPLWYGALALAVLPALVRWPDSVRSPRLLYLHRFSALVLTFFVLGHIVNQALAFVSIESYSAMRSVMRLASQQSISYMVIVTSVAVQIASGVSMGMKRVRAGALTRNLQAVSGWYLAVFLLAHVLSGFLFTPPGIVPGAASANPFNLLASARAAAQLPYYLLGVAAFLFHVGVYARLAALAYLAEASVRRLSYAAAFVGTMVVVTVGLALCGVRLSR